jgi:uncharacterized protein (DUF697 family)
MKALIAIVLAVAGTAAVAANLVSQTTLSNGTTVCVYSDGSTIRTPFNNCPSFK